MNLGVSKQGMAFSHQKECVQKRRACEIMGLHFRKGKSVFGKVPTSTDNVTPGPWHAMP